MEKASDIILEALKQAEKIKAAGKESLLALSARAIDPAAPATLPGISTALGLHPGLVIAVTVAADMAGDDLSRRDMGTALIPQLRFRTSAPALSVEGNYHLALWCFEQLEPVGDKLNGLLDKILPVARAAAAGDPPEAVVIKAAAERANDLQRTKVMQMERGEKSKLGVPPDEAARRRAAQAVRALVKCMEEGGKSAAMLPTVAGEVAGSLGTLLGPQEAIRFCIELANKIEALPSELASRPLPS